MWSHPPQNSLDVGPVGRSSESRSGNSNTRMGRMKNAPRNYTNSGLADISLPAHRKMVNALFINSGYSGGWLVSRGGIRRW